MARNEIGPGAAATASQAIEPANPQERRFPLTLQNEHPFGSGYNVRPPRHDFAIEVNARAIAARAKSNKSVRQIAEETGIEQHIFDSYLAGIRPWRSDHAELFAIACGVSVLALLVGQRFADDIDAMLVEGES